MWVSGGIEDQRESSRRVQAPDTLIRRASAADAQVVGRLLHDFDAEFSLPIPDAEVLAERYGPLLASGEIVVLLAESGPDGFAQLRFRPSVYPGELDAHLEELYVVPARRSQGLGRALLEASMDLARREGAAQSTSAPARTTPPPEPSTRALASPTARGDPAGPVMLYYERDL